MQRSSGYSPNDSPINGYRIAELIGCGPFGEVWKAVRTKTQVMVALKIIDFNAHPNFIKTLPDLKKIRYLESPNLLTIFTARLLDRSGREFRLDDIERASAAGLRRLVVASWLGELSLSARLQREKQKVGSSELHVGIPFDELIEYMKSAAEGLDFMNRPRVPIKENEGVFVHGDVKPSNLIILAGSVLLSDTYQLHAVPTSTSPGSPGWSGAYTPPELTNGRPGPGTDQYSLAVSYYELRTGRLPFPDGCTPAGIAMRHAAGNLDFTSPLLHDNERRVLRWATASRPADRYPTCSEFVRQLEAAVRNWHCYDPSGKTIEPEKAFSFISASVEDDEPPTQDIAEHIRRMLGHGTSEPAELPEHKTFDLPSNVSQGALPEIDLMTPVPAVSPAGSLVPVASPTVEYAGLFPTENPAPVSHPTGVGREESSSPIVVITEQPRDPEQLARQIRGTQPQPPGFVPSYDSKHPSLGINGTTPFLNVPAQPQPAPPVVAGPFTESTDVVFQLARDPISPTPGTGTRAQFPVNPTDPGGKQLPRAELDPSLARLIKTPQPDFLPTPPGLPPIERVIPADPAVWATPPRSGPLPRPAASAPAAPPPPREEPDEHDSKPSWFRRAEQERMEYERRRQQAQLERQERRITRITPEVAEELLEPPPAAQPPSGRIPPAPPPAPQTPRPGIVEGVKGFLGRLWPISRSQAGSTGSEPSTAAIDEDVECTVFLPARMHPGQAGLLQIFVHRSEVDPSDEAMQFDENARSRGRQPLAIEIPRRANLDVEVRLVGMDLVQSQARVVWKGRSSPVAIPLLIPADEAAGNVPGQVMLSLDGEEVATISFLLQITHAGENGPGNRPGNARRNPSRPQGNGR